MVSTCFPPHLRRWSTLGLIGTLFLDGLAPAAHAQTNAITLNGGLVEQAADNGDTSYVLGYSFTVDKPLMVTALGFYDDNNEATPGTAMTQSHQVGIFTQSDGTLRVQTTVSPSSTKIQTLADGAQFRYTSVSSFLLMPGVTYDIAGVTSSDYYEYLPDTFSTAPDVTYLRDQYALGGNVTTLTAPTLTNNNMFGDPIDGYITGQAFFGPNFQFTSPATTTPEPSSLVGLGGGLLGLLGLSLRTRQRRS